jgi:hypothetical protein
VYLAGSGQKVTISRASAASLVVSLWGVSGFTRNTVRIQSLASAYRQFLLRFSPTCNDVQIQIWSSDLVEISG